MAANPLDSLRRQIEAAASIPAAEPYERAGDPLQRLDAILRGDAANDDLSSAPLPSDTDAIVGRELLSILSAEPLPGPARAEVARRIALAMQAPTSNDLRAILSIILSGRAE